jgi:signal-transduction protein with cAMP-binding, CBS, and nucleotidyltransferase domain
MDLRKSLDEPVSKFVNTEVVKVPSTWPVAVAARLMKTEFSTEALVMRGKEAVGIITERDILYKVVADELDPAKTTVEQVMTSPIHSVDAATKVADAIAQMSKLEIRRLLVTRNGKFLGIITQLSLVSGKLADSVPLPELTSPAKFSCPYCGSSMKNANELSKHIDEVHLGMGLLEGNTTKW